MIGWTVPGRSAARPSPAAQSSRGTTGSTCASTSAGSSRPCGGQSVSGTGRSTPARRRQMGQRPQTTMCGNGDCTIGEEDRRATSLLSGCRRTRMSWKAAEARPSRSVGPSGRPAVRMSPSRCACRRFEGSAAWGLRKRRNRGRAAGQRRPPRGNDVRCRPLCGSRRNRAGDVDRTGSSSADDRFGRVP